MQSLSFDRAALFYDETRGFPPGIADLVADAAQQILEHRKRVLEIGIGTGRIAKPMLARGFQITGVDLSRKMMRRLLDTLSPELPRPELIEADAAQLPFCSGGFEAAISVHVFHLIAQWQAALGEVRRVLQPEGVFLTGYEWRPPDTPGKLILDKWREIVGARGVGTCQPGAQDFDEVKAALLESGATMEESAVGEWTTTRSLARHLETIEHRTWSSTWLVPDGFFPQSLAELRAWAVGEFGGLEREFTASHKFIWQKFRW